jgi:hypothetical protein
VETIKKAVRVVVDNGMVDEVADSLLAEAMESLHGFGAKLTHVLAHLGLGQSNKPASRIDSKADTFRRKLNDAVYRVSLTRLLGAPSPPSDFGPVGWGRVEGGGGGGSVYKNTLKSGTYVAAKVPHPRGRHWKDISSTAACQEMLVYEVRVLEHFADDRDFVSVLGCCNVLSRSDPTDPSSKEKRLGFVMEHLQYTLGSLLRSSLFYDQRHFELFKKDRKLLLEVIVKGAEFLLRVIPKMHAATFAHGDFSAGNVCVVFVDTETGKIAHQPYQDLRTVRVTASQIAFKVIDPGMGGRGDKPEDIGTAFTKVTDSFPDVPYGPVEPTQVTGRAVPRKKDTFTRLTDWHQALMLLALMLVNAGYEGGTRLSMADPKEREKVQGVLQGLGETWCRTRAHGGSKKNGWLDLLMTHECKRDHNGKSFSKLCRALRSWQTNDIVKKLGKKFMKHIEVELEATVGERMPKRGRTRTHRMECVQRQLGSPRAQEQVQASKRMRSKCPPP